MNCFNKPKPLGVQLLIHHFHFGTKLIFLAPRFEWRVIEAVSIWDCQNIGLSSREPFAAGGGAGSTLR